MKSIKSKIQASMLASVLVASVLIGIITALLNAGGIDDVITKTLGPATRMAADAVEWRMDSYWTALQEAAASDIFRNSDPTAPELEPVREAIAQRNGFLYTGKMDANGNSSTGWSYAGKDYFQQCKATMQPYISNIMNDGSRIIFLLEVPIITNGRFDGVVYGGINADFLSDIVVNLAMGDDGVAYVLDSTGNVIGHRERSVVEEGSNMIQAARSDPSLADVAEVNQRMIQGETGFGSYNFYGDNKLVGFAPIEGYQNWSIAIEASQHEFKATLDRSILLTILVVILSVLATFPVAVKVGRSISNPIRACVQRLEGVADGDLHAPAPVVKSKDETAKLAKALDNTLIHLNDVLQDASVRLGAMADGDFREVVTTTYRGDFVAMDQSIRTIKSSLRDALSQISQSAGAVANGAHQVADGAQSLSQGATEQASAVCELSATADSIAESAKQTAEDAGRYKVTGSLDKTSSIAGNVSIRMKEVVDAVAGQTTAIVQVTEGINQISDVVQRTSATSEESAATSRELQEQSKLMNRLVGKFRLS